MADPSQSLLSSDDDQVILIIAFNELVNLKAILLTGSGDTKVKVCLRPFLCLFLFLCLSVCLSLPLVCVYDFTATPYVYIH